MNWDPVLISILAPALAAGLLVLSTHVILGQQVLKRGIIFIDLAIAQVAALGAVLVHTWPGAESVPGLHYLLPMLFALGSAAGIALLERYLREELEALIGCLYVLAAVAAMLLLAKDPHGGELLKQLLSGQILWLDWPALRFPALLTGVILALLYWRPHWLSGPQFYLLFALLIPLSVQLVGVYLVFASLVLPALAVVRRQGAAALWWGYTVGVLGFATGLGLSATLDLPSGATIVVTLALAALLARIGLRAR
ncbi:metal ABC transporter permease [Ferrimonas gelatinilytica]|uniref:Metal ABC transporter permease n=1 Tax=Ferrimonas gelatinilytica TaxID=1255257 RepID=A0ABP9S6L3_9GAMM